MWILALCAPALAMSLDEAVESARAISPVGDLSEARLAAAQAQIREADSYLKPQLDAGVGAALQNEIVYWIGEELDTTQIPVDPNAFPEMIVQPGYQLQSQISLTQGLWAPQVQAYREAARTQEDWAIASAEEDALLVTEGVIEAWHASARFHALAEAAASTVALAERLAEVGDALVEFGAATEDDLLPIHQAEAQARAGLRRAEAASAAADRALQTLTGQSGPADAVTAPAGAPSLDALLGVIDHPELRAADALTRSAEALTEAERKAAWPIVGVTGSAAYIFPSPDVADNFNWRVMLGAQIPLYSGGRIDARTDEAAARAAQAAAAADAKRSRAEIEVIRAHGELSTALAATGEHEEAVALGQRAVAAAEVRFREGSGSAFELQQAQIALAQSEVLLINARHDAAQARDRLLFAVSGEVSKSAALRAFPQARDPEMLE